MKKFAIVSIMAAVLVISASIAIGGNLYCPWLIESMDNSDPIAGSINSGVYVYNTSGTDVVADFTLRKYGTIATATTKTLTFPLKDTTEIDWYNYTHTSSGDVQTDWFPNGQFPAIRIGTIEIDNQSNDLIGFASRFKSNFSVIYSEHLWAWTANTGSD